MKGIAESFGPHVPDWLVAEYYANGPQPYVLRLLRMFTEAVHVSSRQPR
jgi:hypothetical protein